MNTNESVLNAKKLGLICADEVIKRISLGHCLLPGGINLDEILNRQTKRIEHDVKPIVFHAFVERLIKHIHRREAQIKRFQNCVEQFNQDQTDFESYVQSVIERPALLDEEIFLRSIDTIGLKPHAKQALNRENIYCIKDLVIRTEIDIRKIPNLGDMSFRKIENALKSLELTFGMSLPEWLICADKEAA